MFRNYETLMAQRPAEKGKSPQLIIESNKPRTFPTWPHVSYNFAPYRHVVWNFPPKRGNYPVEIRTKILVANKYNIPNKRNSSF